MFLFGSRAVVAALTTLAVLVGAASASGAQRFAAPAGTASACSQALPCSVSTAIDAANSGDEVIIAGNEGSYGTPTAPLSPIAASRFPLSIHGAAGQPRPVIYLSGTNGSCSCVLDLESTSAGNPVTLSDLDVEDLSSTSGTALFDDGPIDHTIVHATQTNVIVCNLGEVNFAQEVTDSICEGDSADYALQINVGGASGTVNVGLRNDTIETPEYYGLTAAANGGVGVSLTATNVIVHGGSRDVDAYASGGSAVSVTMDHSNYSTVTASSPASVTAAGTGTNQAAPPQFVNAADDDFHEAAGSPTIAAGITSPANGDTDLDGDPRSVNGETDIGAYQFIPPAAVLTPPHNTRITSAEIKKHRRSAIFHFSASGTVAGFECALIKAKPKRKHHRHERQPRPRFSACSSPKAYKHRGHGKYTFEVRAFNAAGVDPAPAIRKFRL